MSRTHHKLLHSPPTLHFSAHHRGESVRAIESAMFPKTTTALHIVLLDNMDVVFQKLSDSLTAITLTSTLLNAIDTFRMHTKQKGFIVATCTDMTHVPEGLLRLARFGEPKNISYPSADSRTAVALRLLLSLSSSLLEQLLKLVEVSSLSTLHTHTNSVGERKEMITTDNSRKSELCSILATEISRRTQVLKDTKYVILFYVLPFTLFGSRFT